jgi:hypothetical protein
VQFPRSLVCNSVCLVCNHQRFGRYSSLYSVAFRYGLDGAGFESRWGRDLPHSSRLALGPTQPPLKRVPAVFPGLKRSGRGINTPPPPSSAEVKDLNGLVLWWNVLVSYQLPALPIMILHAADAGLPHCRRPIPRNPDRSIVSLQYRVFAYFTAFLYWACCIVLNVTLIVYCRVWTMCRGVIIAYYKDSNATLASEHEKSWSDNLSPEWDRVCDLRNMKWRGNHYSVTC